MERNSEWLAAVRETALEPDLPILDPHHHLWDYPGNRYLLDELRSDTRGAHNVIATVFVECGSNYFDSGDSALRPVGETVFVESIARQSVGREDCPEIGAIVGFADLLSGSAVRPILEAHMAASPSRFRGIRHACAWDPSEAIRVSHVNPPPQLYLREDFRRGFAVLADMGLVFDSWLYHTQLGELADLADAFPDTTIVCDHVGGPLGIGPYEKSRQQVYADWQVGIARLAQCPNVVVKLGGLAMPINGFGWHHRQCPPTSLELAEAQAPYYLYCIEQFGARRCMFESNFPVDKVSCSYTVLWNAFKRVVASFSASDKAALFYGNAARVYSVQ